jgi:Flp pilus assembly protein TadG
MTKNSSLRGLGSMLALLAGDREGVAALEFALILPIMLMLLFGGVEVTQAIACKRMVSLTASTVANIVTQYPTISQTEQMPDILNASTAVLTPYPVANAVVTVSLISVDNGGNATVAWSQSKNGTARSVGASVTLPAALDTPNTNLILGETSYAYNAAFDYLHLGTFNLYSSVYMFPRSLSGTVTLGP